MSRSSRIWIGLVPAAPAEAPPVSGAISATASIVFSDSATVTGAGPIDATEALAFSELAALSGLGDLIASEAITFSELAALVGTGALNGSESISFSELAALSGLGALIASEVITFGNVVTITVLDTQIQDQFRFGADDGGTEATHGWIAAQNVDITQPGNIAAILRIQLNNYGDFPSQQMKVQYKISTQDDSEYRDVPVAL